MENVQLIEFRTFRIQSIMWSHVFLRNNFVHVSSIRPNQEMMHLTSVRLRSVQEFSNTALVYGRRTTGKQKKHYRGCLRKTKRDFTSIWDRWQNDEQYEASQTAIGWSDAFVRYWTTSQELISLMVRRRNREVDTKISFFYDVSTKEGRLHLQNRGQGTTKRRLH